MAVLIEKETCTGCADCVDACPTEAIQMVEEKAVVDEDTCTDCGACVDTCPSGAITMP